jgi:RluA family pseudouridine synthase
MAKSNFIELPGCEPIPILYEDRSVLAIDKPVGWMLAPVSWRNTSRNLQAAIESSITAGDFWARSHGLKFLRYVHRLDADASGVLLFAKGPGAVKTYSDLFESRQMEKTYLAVVVGESKQTEWTCRLKLAPDAKRIGRMKVDSRHGKPAETHFRVLESRLGIVTDGSRGRSPHRLSLVECKPITGRTHQIRVHLAESGTPVVGDELYGKPQNREIGRAALPRRQAERQLGPTRLVERVTDLSAGALAKVEGRVRGLPLGLRAVRLAYVDPFTKKRVDIHGPAENFLKQFGFLPKPSDEN